MASFGRYGSQSYAPSAPSLPEEQSYGSDIPFPPPPPPANANSYAHQTHSHGHGIGYGQDYSHALSGFPPGTHADVIRSFQMVDSDRSGFIDENELQQALSSGYQKFSLGTIRLLMFLFKNPNEPLRIGPKEFAALWSCLGQWCAIFERFDKDKSGKINLMELRDALHSIGYVISQPVLQLLISKYDNGGGQRGELNFDSFIECGMIVKGLTEKFKEKDARYTGTATLSYDTFMLMELVQYLSNEESE